jgi:hypothetical protein
MSAATRRRTARTALAVLLPLTLSGAAVTAPPGTSRAAAPAGVSVEVASGGKTPLYRIEVRNESNTEVTTTVRLGLPRNAVIQSISNGGQARPAEPTGTEVAWRLRLPAHGAATLRTLLKSAPHTPLSAPACAFVEDGPMAYDCETAVWGLSAASKPWWQRTAEIIWWVGALLVAAAVGVWWLWRRRRRRGRRGPARVLAAASEPPARLKARPKPPATGPSTGKPGASAGNPGASATAERAARRPATWKVVSSAAFLFFGTVTALGWISGSQMMALAPSAESTSGAWVGTARTGRIGTPIRDAAFEFTVYRLACEPDAEPGRQRCVANIGLHNVSDASQRWYAGMQRAYLPSGTWITADEAATRAANGNQDIFAYPIPAGGRLLAPLVFTLPVGATPTKIELRSAVFSAGVAIVP